MLPFNFAKAFKARGNYSNEERKEYLPAASEEGSAFIVKDEEEHEISFKPATDRRLRRYQCTTVVMSFIILFLLVLLSYLLRASNGDSTIRIFSPADSAIEYETVVFHNNFHEDRTPYQGPPTDEVDRHWNELYGGIGIVRIDRDDALRLPNQTLSIPGEDEQFIVGIEVFHQLHCLNSIRKALYPERYHETENLVGDALLEYQIHLEHCVDSLRQTVQCYSDVSTIPWIINPYHGRPAPDAHTTHTCRNFGKVQDWARKRAFTQEQYNAQLAAHPYPER